MQLRLSKIFKSTSAAALLVMALVAGTGCSDSKSLKNCPHTRCHTRRSTRACGLSDQRCRADDTVDSRDTTVEREVIAVRALARV